MSRAEEEQRVLRRGLIAELIREVARSSDVGRDSRRRLFGIANALTVTPGVDGTCRSCGSPLPTQYRGRPRVYCDNHVRASRRPAKNVPKP